MLLRKRPRKITLQRQISHNNEVLPISITLSKRRSFAIVVRPNMEVHVKAPLRSNIDNLLKRVHDKIDWIIHHRRRFAALPAAKPPKQYVAGESFNFMGVKYVLRVSKAAHPKVVLNDGYMDVFCKTQTPSAVKTLLRFWYNEQATKIFEERLEHCLMLTAPLKLPKIRALNIKRMKSRWGSCAHTGVITLNPELVAAPLECIDYVIVHELCHLRQLNHSPRFYKLQAAIIPDWKARKVLLNKTTETKFL